METSGAECESWYNFIRYDGNEEALQHLQHSLEKVDFYVLDDLSTFDLDLDHLVSEQTAKEMCSVDLNATMFHRKFDGKMTKIHFEFSKKDDNEDRIQKVNDKIGQGDIDQYVEDEDPCDEDYRNGSQSESDHEENDEEKVEKKEEKKEKKEKRDRDEKNDDKKDKKDRSDRNDEKHDKEEEKSEKDKKDKKEKDRDVTNDKQEKKKREDKEDKEKSEKKEKNEDKEDKEKSEKKEKKDNKDKNKIRG